MCSRRRFCSRTRINVSQIATLLLGGLLSGVLLRAQQPDAPYRYRGTIGQQQVTLTLDVAGDKVSGGRYLYKGQKTPIPIVDSRQFGTTVILQDEDGNILHLHFETIDGEKSSGFKTAAMLEGTLDRRELDLPVKLKREEAVPSRP